MFQDRMSSLTYFLATTMTPELKRNQFGPMVDQYSYSYQVRNETRFTIAIVNRAGLRTVIPPMAGHGSLPGSLNIRCINSPRIGIISDVDDQFIAGEVPADDETLRWRQAVYEKAAAITNGLREMQSCVDSVLVYRISESEIKKNSGALYVANLDIVVAVMDGTRKLPPVHPFSRLGSISLVHEHTTESFGDTGVLYAVKIVDRRAAYGDRFMNIAGRVVHIKADDGATITLRDGVYVTANLAADGKMIDSSRDTILYSFKDADAKLPLYKTCEEAKTLGNPEEIRNRELADLKREIENERHTQAAELLESRRKLTANEEVFEIAKREHARDVLRQEQELAQTRLKHQEREGQLKALEQDYREREHALKTDTLNRKYVQDTQSDQRKVTLEVLKYVPAVIGGVITAVNIYKKLSK